jgi:alkanesulfonate monooxygenase
MEPFDALAEKFDLVRRHSDTPPKFAVRVDILARETEEEAWDELRRGWARVGETERTPESSESVGWQRGREFTAAAGDSLRDLEVHPNVWAGFNKLRPGPLFGLVGDYHQVAERLDELITLGVDAFILAGVPHLEEAQRVGRHVLPLLKGKLS